MWRRFKVVNIELWRDYRSSFFPTEEGSVRGKCVIELYQLRLWKHFVLITVDHTMTETGTRRA